MATASLARIKAAKAQSTAKHNILSKPYEFAHSFLGMDLLSPEFHKPICEWLYQYRGHKRRALYSPRYSYKTSLLKAEILMEILDNPEVTIAIVSHSLALSVQTVNEVGQEILKNDDLREMLGEQKPNRKSKWLRDGYFMMPRLQRKSEQPTVAAYSTGTDMTGIHTDIIYGDDLISAKVVAEMGGLDGIDNWWQHTAVPVVGVGGTIRITGTRWSYDDLYAKTLTDPKWVCMLRGLLETDGKPDPLGKPIPLKIRDGVGQPPRYITLDDVVAYKNDMKYHFNGQMLNLPEPEGGRPWVPATCEHYVKLDDISQYVRQIIILVDPAPRGFGDHDYWAIAVVAYYELPDSPGVMRRSLIDGIASKEWTLDDGNIQILRLLKKWDTYGSNIVGMEEAIGAAKNARFFCEKLKETCRGRHRVNPIPFRSTQRGKQPRLADLVSLAESGFFTIADSVPRPFLQLFLNQVRSIPDQHEGHDDLADAVAYLDDPALMEHIPKTSIIKRKENRWWALDADREDDWNRRSKFFAY